MVTPPVLPVRPPVPATAEPKRRRPSEREARSQAVRDAAIRDALDTLMARFPELRQRHAGIRWNLAYTSALNVLREGGWVTPYEAGYAARYVRGATPGAIRRFLRERRARLSCGAQAEGAE